MIDTAVSDPKVRSIATESAGETKAAPLPQRTESRQALSPQNPSPTGAEPTNEEIAALAYQLWLERGSPHGSHDEDWYRAERELRQSKPRTKTASA